MFQKIERNDGIFQSDLFLKDSMAFCVIEAILSDTIKYPSPKLFSDGKDCVIVNSDPDHAVIVWTSDDFRAQDELYDFIKKEFHGNSVFKIMAKKSFYDYLVEHHKIPRLEVQTLGVYSCIKLNDIKYFGHPDHAKPEETDQIARMLVNFDHETGENPNTKLSDYADYVNEFVVNPMCFVWRGPDEKVVAIANLRINDHYSRVGRVYTNAEERGKSYAKMIVHYLTSQIFERGKKAMIFTNYDYAPSNRCYQAIGYQLNCTIVNFMPSLKEEN